MKTKYISNYSKQVFYPMNNHPHLKTLHSLYLSETQAFRKVHRMIDLFESIIKMHTVVILSEYVTNNKLSYTANDLLAKEIRKEDTELALVIQFSKRGMHWKTCEGTLNTKLDEPNQLN